MITANERALHKCIINAIADQLQMDVFISHGESGSYCANQKTGKKLFDDSEQPLVLAFQMWCNVVKIAPF